MELVQLVTFEVGGELFGVDVSKIHSVIKYDKVTPTPEAMDLIEGVIDLRGEIIPVVDLHKRFRLTIPEDYLKTKILIVEVREYIFGFIVGKVNEVYTFDLSEISAPPPGISRSGNEFTVGVLRKGDQLLLYLDVDEVLNIEELLKGYDS
ncbi:chemotaxis protein CheW [Deltaproteobacteria bacterium TL4]